MKLIVRRLTLPIVASLLLAGISAAPAAAAAPTVWTEPATEVTATEATLNAKIQVKVAPTDILAGFQYGLTTEYGQASEAKMYHREAYIFTISQRVSGLTPGKTYHFQAAAWDYKYGGGSFGEDLTFKTNGGLYLTHESSGEENAIFQASSSMVSFVGTEPSQKMKFNFGELWTECSANESLAAWTTSFTQFNAAEEGFPGCSGSAKVSMHGCHFQYGLNSAGPPYNGSMSIVCGKSSMEVVFPGICTATIGAQSASGTPASYETIDRGKDSAVKVVTNATGLTYSKSGPYCFLLNGKTASITGEMVLHGS